MSFFLFALLVLVLSGLVAWVSRRESVGFAGAVLGSAAGLVAPARAIFLGETASIRLPWNVPYGSFSLEIDALTAFFLLPMLLLSGLAALYALEYLGPYRKTKSLGHFWFFYNLLVAGMMIVVAARNGVLFLTAWELTAVASFFLVVFENEKPSARQAGWSYLVAGQAGTAFLLVLFTALGRGGGLDFDRFGGGAAGGANVMFLLALVGFGTKAGFFPLHIWLPEAHPAAPSPVSALMSGTMIKLGIYGLLRFYVLLGPGPAWWGGLLIAVGAVSGILGVLFALAQHDLKRLLAYHSVENMGIIALGMGLGMLGEVRNDPVMAALGFGGCLLHVLNHGLFKSLLFLGAGAAAQATGTREIDLLGGLNKRMPWTSAFFLTGAAAISGLPPLNGFVSELLIFLAAFRGVSAFGPSVAAPSAAAIASLALIGGLAVACFAKSFGVVFLGEPRSDHPLRAREPGWKMLVPMGALAFLCAVIGLAPAGALRIVRPAVLGIARFSTGGFPTEAFDPVLRLAVLGAVLLALTALFAALRAWLLKGREVREGLTWDCGYAFPSPRMQYTASSFAQPLTSLFSAVLGTRTSGVLPSGFFPAAAEFSSATPDAARDRFFKPAFGGVRRFLGRLRCLQHGRLQIYVLYLVLTLLAFLFWKLR